MPGRRKKGLSEEERQLWEQVARTTRPLKPAKPPKRAHKTDGQPPPPKPIPEPVKPLPTLSRIGRSVQEPRTAILLAADPMVQTRKPGADIDRRSFDRLRKGRMEPEARIDLHGLTAELAHRRLLAFVRSQYAGGKRLLLVITGKGNTMREEEGIMPVRRGVIRHALPMWLSSPDIAPIILQITEAHPRHGGGGAYYVYLRRRRQ